MPSEACRPGRLDETKRKEGGPLPWKAVDPRGNPVLGGETVDGGTRSGLGEALEIPVRVD